MVSDGPPGTSPASTAGAMYLRTVFGSMASDEHSSPIRRPACQCTQSSTTSITLIVLLATSGPPRLAGRGDAETDRWPERGTPSPPGNSVTEVEGIP